MQSSKQEDGGTVVSKTHHNPETLLLAEVVGCARHLSKQEPGLSLSSIFSKSSLKQASSQCSLEKPEVFVSGFGLFVGLFFG